MKTHVTQAAAFTPAGHQVPRDLLGHAFGLRKNALFNKAGEDQYLVYAQGFDAQSDPQANHVIGSGFSFSHAIISARKSQALKQVKPDRYWKRLQGCRFIEVVEDGNVALQHVVVDGQGRELGRADTREAAAKLALHRALVDASDITFDEFKAIAVPVHVTQGGKKSYGSVFYDHVAQDALGSLVRTMFKACPSVREAAHAMRSKTTYAGRNVSVREEGMRALLAACQQDALSGMGDSVGRTYAIAAEDGAWQAFAVMHTTHFSAETAMMIAYEAHLEDILEKESVNEQGGQRFSG